MKNLRKILAVVLVVCITLSFAVTASAAYTDDSSIKYTTAVGALSGIGAINGQPDGSFNPTGLVTRAEAAKLICYAILGPTLAKNISSTGTTGFSDVPSTHWASGNIGYLVGKGIIGGRGDGTFDPNGNVTGAEMAKMLLCAAGYGKNNEYSGANWEFNVVTDAFNMKVFEGSAQSDFSKAATREEAALYTFNALMNIEKVTYSKVNDAYTSIGQGKTIANVTYGMVAPVTGIITGNQATGLKGTTLAVATIPTTGASAGKITDLSLSSTLYKYTTSLKAIGTVVKVYYKDADTIYYMETLSKTISSAFGTTGPNGYKTNFGTAKASAYVVNVTANIASVTVDAFLGKTISAFNSTTGATQAGTFASFGGDIVSWTEAAKSTVQKVTAIGKTAGSESITLSTAGVKLNNATTDVVNVYDEVAVGDLVTVTPAGTMFNIDKTSTVTGTMSKMDTTFSFMDMPGYVVDGKTYYKSATDTTGIGFATIVAADYGKTTFTLTLNATGSCVGLKAASASASNVVYVVAPAYSVSGAYGPTYSVQTVDSTGKEIIYNAGPTNPAVTGGFYKVTLDATTSLASFSQTFATTDLVQTTANTNAASVVKTSYKVGSDFNGSSYYYASDVNFIFISDKGATLKIEKVTGLAAADGNLLTIPSTAMMYINSTTSTNKTVTTVIVPHALVSPSAAGAKLLYLPLGVAATANNADGSSYTIYIDGVKTTVTSNNAAGYIYQFNWNPATYQAGRVFVDYSVNATTGVYTFGSKIDESSTNGIHYSKTLAKNSVFNGYVDGRTLAATAVIVDNATSAYGDNAGSPVTSYAAMEALTATTDFVVDYVTDASGAITVLYIYSMTPGR